MSPSTSRNTTWYDYEYKDLSMRGEYLVLQLYTIFQYVQTIRAVQINAGESYGIQ